MTVLVIAEHNNSELNAATLAAITAATQLKDAVNLLIAGSGCSSVAEAAAKVQGVSRVLLADAPAYEHQLAENVAPLVVRLAEGHTHLLMPATTNGKNLMPRVAALLDVAQISDIIAIKSTDCFQRPIYAGNVIATVQSKDSLKVVTVRATAFEPAIAEGGNAMIDQVEASGDLGLCRWERDDVTESTRPDLAQAEVVVSGGRGLGSAENFQLLEALADKLGAAIGASRAAVDAGFVSNDLQVGQTGKVVAPKLYIAVGISGAIQHLAGMKESKVIVAINKDEDAPIFQIADYGIVGDLFDILPALSAELDRSVN
ncbi:MAG: FAD-binding protein [Candidatus Thiodiazotropha sp. (ex Lucinoma borealis)]|nr:FAD-binding protein [Candidatus Thiodiazotropha sp. (ex Lucinoma borealis)]MCU7840917.1 FAD-binding protein [Candidatus Thiodiazotropha sp. (ex Troendleina suluensis)]MCU7945509.1 FAD-binding protein [Candidatus Thiodiazotropha sp. (ex Cardiolucina cf. quadrata)]MCU7866203.1 FAD-binding protein [Candidatus Thiodiazotropha sp. (ex Lucinoma borealis)]MCU7869779.1 FAD-binding protein [Candidatus Thiodiazotropha sp. (ex Lucinoma borealis)]